VCGWDLSRKGSLFLQQTAKVKECYDNSLTLNLAGAFAPNRLNLLNTTSSLPLLTFSRWRHGTCGLGRRRSSNDCDVAWSLGKVGGAHACEGRRIQSNSNRRATPHRSWNNSVARMRPAGKISRRSQAPFPFRDLHVGNIATIICQTK
jgi:hypothetical protein